MGILLDTVEDNDESSGWKVEAIRQKLGIFPSPPKKLPSCDCPVCHKFFFTEGELQDHIFNEHRHERYYMRIKGRLLNEGIYLEESDIQHINYDDLEEKILNLQNRVDKNDCSIDWSKYKKPLMQHTEHPLRKQYLSGFLDYLGAHQQEINNNSADYQYLSDHFGKAYSNLQPFSSYLAQQTRKAIALKMNWFNQLQDVSESSLFFLAWHFFSHKHTNVASVQGLPAVSSKQKQGIIIDGFHEELLEALRLYYCERSSLNYNWLHKLQMLVNEINNRNYLDKLALLKARLFREWGNTNYAKEAYHSIRTHPNFGAEAREYNG